MKIRFVVIIGAALLFAITIAMYRGPHRGSASVDPHPISFSQPSSDPQPSARLATSAGARDRAALRGTVVDENGTSVAGAEIWLEDHLARRVTRSSDTGAFGFDDVDGEVVFLTARTLTHASARVRAELVRVRPITVVVLP